MRKIRIEALLPEDTPYDIYRVFLGHFLIKVERLGSFWADGNPLIEDGWYDKFEDLPEDVQHKLAVLRMLPEKGSNEVADVGMRLSDSVFWLYMGGGNENTD